MPDDGAKSSGDDWVTTDALLAGIAAGANDILKAAGELLKVARLSRAEKVVALGLMIGNLILLGGLVILGALILGTGQTNKQTLQAVQSCTTPGGVCYENGRSQTAKAVDQLARVAILSVECSRVTTTDAAFEKCLADRSAAQR